MDLRRHHPSIACVGRILLPTANMSIRSSKVNKGYAPVSSTDVDASDFDSTGKKSKPESTSSSSSSSSSSVAKRSSSSTKMPYSAKPYIPYVPPEERPIFGVIPRMVWWKYLVFAGYAFFAFIYCWALVQGAWAYVGPIVDWTNEKFMERTVLGGRPANTVYVRLGAEFMMEEPPLREFTFAPASNLKEGQAINECRIACAKMDACVFFSVYSEAKAKATDDVRCVLHGLGLAQQNPSVDYDSGILLNRLNSFQASKLALEGTTVYPHSKQRSEELMMEEHWDSDYRKRARETSEADLGLKKNPEWPEVTGKAGHYLSQFPVGEYEEVFLLCATQCFSQGAKCKDFLYKFIQTQCFHKPLVYTMGQ